MPSLEDLTDVGDLSGAIAGDRLTYDDGSGLWVPATPAGPELVEYDVSVTYPAGDNGWTLVDELSPTVPATYVGSDTSTPAADAALVYEFTATSAMLASATGPAPEGVATGMRLSLSFVTAFTANRTVRVSVTVNGNEVAYDSNGRLANRVRVGQALGFPCSDGDVVKVHVWVTSGTDSITLVLVAGAPVLIGAPDVRAAGSIIVGRSEASAFSGSQLVTAPSGVAVSLTGSTSIITEWGWVRSNGETSYSNNTSTLGAWALLSAPRRWLMQYYGTADGVDNTAAGDPYLFRTRQVDTLQFLALVLADPLV